MSFTVLKKEDGLDRAIKVITIKTLLYRTFYCYVMSLNPMHSGGTVKSLPLPSDHSAMVSVLRKFCGL